MSAMNEMFTNFMEEGLRKEMNLPNHYYRDISWMTAELWDTLLDTMGIGNYVLVASTTKETAEHGLICRGQFMISPQGMDNLRKLYEKEETEEAQNTQS